MAELGAQRRGPALYRLEVAVEVLPAALGELLGLGVRGLGVLDLELLELVGQQQLLELALPLDVDLARAVLHLVERRLRDVDEAAVDQLLHLAVEEGEHQGADVGAVDVRVGHQHDLVVAEVLDLELVLDPGADRGDQRLDLVVGEDLVDPALLDVDDLASQRQHRLGVAVAALLRRAAGRVALDDEELRQRRVLDRAVGELARQHRVLQSGLAPGQVARLAGRVAGAGGVDRLGQDAAGVRRVLLEEVAELAVDDLLDQALDRRVPELALGLTLELRVGELHRHHCGEALADVLAGEVLVLLLEQSAVLGDRIQGPGQSRPEPGEMGAALVGVDVVGEAEGGLLVGGVPLQSDLDLAILGLALEVDDLPVQRVLRLVQVLDEVRDAALVEELDLAALGALVDQLDLQPARQKGGLAQPLGEDVEVEVDFLEDLGIGPEGDRRAGALHRPALLELGGRLASRVGLGPDGPVPPDLEVELLGERVDDRDADAVQAARDLVTPAVAELAAGVQGRQHDLGRGPVLGLLHLLDRDPAAVIDHRAAVVRMQGHGDPLGMAGDRLVDGVVHHLVDEVVQSAGAGRADVHAGALANGLEALEDGDVLGAVGGALRAGLRCALGLGCGALGGTIRAGGALLARSSALGGLRHSASFRFHQGMPRPS